jgi:ribosomal protein S6
MNKDKEEIRKSNYEVLCIIKENESNRKENLIEEIENLISPEKVKSESKIKELKYTIDNLNSAEYLLLNFTTEKNKISLIEKTLTKSFIIRYMLINLDKEKKIVMKSWIRSQGVRKPKRPNFDKSFVKQEKKEWIFRKNQTTEFENSQD